jgi:hypothetical protein
MAVGLAGARRYEDRSGPLTALLLPVAAIFAAVVGVIAIAQSDFGAPMSPVLALYIATSFTLGVVRVAVWAWLTTVLLRGAQAGEDPIAGWRLGVLGGLLVLIALALVNVSGLLRGLDETSTTLFGYVLTATYALGHVSLLNGFMVGLPALDELDEADDDIEFETGGPVYEDRFEDGEPGRDARS